MVSIAPQPASHTGLVFRYILHFRLAVMSLFVLIFKQRILSAPVKRFVGSPIQLSFLKGCRCRARCLLSIHLVRASCQRFATDALESQIIHLGSGWYQLSKTWPSVTFAETARWLSSGVKRSLSRQYGCLRMIAESMFLGSLSILLTCHRGHLS